ncbi:MAG: glutamate-5-semialdehyde dehydrogenase [Ruminococcaceae bacterium]|nr:glutamate-5-semialdehyde dehydrogenase [Oscillospiraceae bacterium]
MLREMGRRAKEASLTLMNLDAATKSAGLVAIANALTAHTDEILAENKKDVDAFLEKGGSAAMADRLRLTKERIAAMAEGVLKVNALPEVVGEVLGMTKRPNGLVIGKKRVPLGVIGMIYEARPNVTVDAAVLCLKTSNACILRGGSEAIFSNSILTDIMTKALHSAGFPDGSLQLVRDTSRETVVNLMRLNEYLDVLIPRGGKGLIQSVVQNATVPVIETGTGNCHIYIEKTADMDMAVRILYNAKTSRPSVCNAAESLLVDRLIAKEVLPQIALSMAEKQVELRGCDKTREILPEIKTATEEDFYTEYNDYILSIKVVEDIHEAIAHINTHGTGHSEAIITSDYTSANLFLDSIDAAAVYVNASTRFTDGDEFGFGAEIGISTQKLHARGPMGLEALTSTKYIVYGNGQVRE